MRMAKAIDWSGLFKKYRGKWLALKGEKTVIAVGDSAQEVYDAAQKLGYKIPHITRMPDELVPAPFFPTVTKNEV
jgi:hypothetical protein